MKWVRLAGVLVLLLGSETVAAQEILYQDFTLLENRLYEADFLYADTTGNGESDDTTRAEYPSPKLVMFKSMMIPGWGQIENRQIWKVPVIYALFTGVAVYSIYLNGQYQDYRAAYYNNVQGEDSDFRYGETPERLEGLPAEQLQTTRNSFRNQRDFSFIIMGLAYGLNVLDAYVYAHMRSFDVSDDLSARTVIQPVILAEGVPGVRFSFSLSKKTDR